MIVKDCFINVHSHFLRPSTSTHVNVYNHFIQDPVLPAKDILFSVGLHPWHLNVFSKKILKEKLLEIGATKNCCFVGETGLDKLRGGLIKEQKEFFLIHVEVAEELKKPLIIHNVKCSDILMDIKKKYKPQQPWIFHGFNQNKAVANELIKQNCWISFGKALFNLQNPASDSFLFVSAERWLLETDGEYQISIEEVYAKASEIKKISVEKIKEISNKTFNSLFTI